jgi:hypothetical protein
MPFSAFGANTRHFMPGVLLCLPGGGRDVDGVDKTTTELNSFAGKELAGCWMF